MGLGIQHAPGLKLSNNNVKTQILKLYGHMDPAPVYHQFMKDGERAYGFNYLTLNRVKEYNRSDANRAINMQRTELIKMHARHDYDGCSQLGKRGAGEIE
jgi:hypothetical protein